MTEKETTSKEDCARLWARLRELRMKRGLSLRELAAQSGVAFASLWKIETGRYNASAEVLAKICAALDARLDIVEN